MMPTLKAQRASDRNAPSKPPTRFQRPSLMLAQSPSDRARSTGHIHSAGAEQRAGRIRCVRGLSSWPVDTVIRPTNQPASRAIPAACRSAHSAAAVLRTGAHADRTLVGSGARPVRISRIDAATGVCTGCRGPALGEGCELAVARIAPAGPLQAIARRRGGQR
jgi:hypothetical protein